MRPLSGARSRGNVVRVNPCDSQPLRCAGVCDRPGRLSRRRRRLGRRAGTRGAGQNWLHRRDHGPKSARSGRTPRDKYATCFHGSPPPALGRRFRRRIRAPKWPRYRHTGAVWALQPRLAAARGSSTAMARRGRAVDGSKRPTASRRPKTRPALRVLFLTYRPLPPSRHANAQRPG